MSADAPDELGPEEVFEREIKPLLEGATVRDLDEIISLLVKLRAATASKSAPTEPIGASLVTTGLLRFNPLPKLHKSFTARVGHSNLPKDDRFIGAHGAGGVTTVDDPLLTYDINATLLERRAQIKSMLNSPPVQSEQVEARMGGASHGCKGRHAAFRMRSSNIGSSITGRHARFY